jgi:hypothetical protein
LYGNEEADTGIRLVKTGGGLKSLTALCQTPASSQTVIYNAVVVASGTRSLGDTVISPFKTVAAIEFEAKLNRPDTNTGNTLLVLFIICSLDKLFGMVMSFCNLSPKTLKHNVNRISSFLLTAFF